MGNKLALAFLGEVGSFKRLLTKNPAIRKNLQKKKKIHKNPLINLLPNANFK
jgi:hypothetical protein